jgi:HSP20 family protein
MRHGLLHGAVAESNSRSFLMYLFPASVATRRVASAPSLARAFDHLFADRDVERSAEPRVPTLDVAENDTAYTLTLDLPGLSKDQLKVSVQGRRVTIEAGTEKAAETKEGERVLYRERGVAHYARTVSLPSEVDQSASSAKFENGVLVLTIAKKVPTGATQIAIS